MIIINRPSSTTDSANARSSRASGSASAVTRSMTTMANATSAMPSQHGGADADNFFNFAVNAQAYNDPVQRDRNDDRLEHERNQRGNIQVGASWI